MSTTIYARITVAEVPAPETAVCEEHKAMASTVATYDDIPDGAPLVDCSEVGTLACIVCGIGPDGRGEPEKFCVTFGQKFRREPHPVLGLRTDLPDGWITVSARDELAARQRLIGAIGRQWSAIHPAEHFGEDEHYYPNGCLGTLEQVLEQATPPEVSSQ